MGEYLEEDSCIETKTIGRQFVSTLAAEVFALSKGDSKSEISKCFPSLILQ